jgi:hypothetical protein
MNETSILVLPTILFNVIVGGIANKLKGENRMPDRKTLIFSDSILSWGKDKKETEEYLSHWNLIMNE